MKTYHIVADIPEGLTGPALRIEGYGTRVDRESPARYRVYPCAGTEGALEDLMNGAPYMDIHENRIVSLESV